MSIAAMMRARARGFAFTLAITCYLAPQSGLAQIPELSGGKLPTLAPLVREVTPSVVNISVRGRVKEDNPLYRDPIFREFLDGLRPVPRTPS